MRFSTSLGTLAVAAISVLAASTEKRLWNDAGYVQYSDPNYGITWPECMCIQNNGSVSFHEWNSIAAEPPPGGVGDGCNPPWQLFGPAPSNIPGYNPKQVLGGIY